MGILRDVHAGVPALSARTRCWSSTPRLRQWTSFPSDTAKIGARDGTRALLRSEWSDPFMPAPTKVGIRVIPSALDPGILG